jgi:hypothetical protein
LRDTIGDYVFFEENLIIQEGPMKGEVDIEKL